MLCCRLWKCFFLLSVLSDSTSLAQATTTSASSIILEGTNLLPSSLPAYGGDLVPSGPSITYISYTTTTSQNGSIAEIATVFALGNATSAKRKTSSSKSVSLLQGTLSSPTATNRTASATVSTSAAPVNTQPCNNHPEFCDRAYSNITYVAAHNSPFVNPNNAAANQALGVFDQLNDGIRMLQGQTHFNATTNTISYCHTSCDLLNAGTAEEYFANITTWVRAHPYDVVTLLIGNADFIGVGNYTIPLDDSGLSQYAYVPSQVPMNRTAWPTLGEMILSQKRVVIFMDYNANQSAVPYILDEFSQMWETPFSPTNSSFPCTQQRPPGLDQAKAEQLMYMANHNLNTKVTLLDTSILIPNTAVINQTNAVSGYSSLGLMADECAATWPQPPNFLLVDYYNEGNVPGSVFQVAARHNNVTYNIPCCGKIASDAHATRAVRASTAWLVALITVAVFSL